MDIFKGVTFGYYGRNGYFSSAKAREEVNHIAELGVPWVCLISTIMQEAYYSTRQFRDFYMTPGDDELVDIIGYLHKKGIKVMLRPMIECWDGTQRGNLHLPQGEIFPERPFRYKDEWFKNYAAVTAHYLRIASKTGCEAYGLDSELNQLVGYSEDWLKIINIARKSYKGHLTTSLINSEQYLHKITQDSNFWLYALDSVGTSCYYPASEDGSGTIEDMVEFLRPHAASMKEFSDKLGTCFYFGECGCCATENATKLPYYWKNGKKYDGQQQANYMSAIIRLFSAEPWWKGMFWWKWDENNFRAEFVEDPAGDKGFTIYGKPAAEVMKNWCLENH